MKKNIELEDVAEVLAYVMSQERVMTVPPVLIPTDGSTIPRKRPRKQPRNMKYTKKDLSSAQSISKGSLGSLADNPEEFPIEKDEFEVESCDIATFDELEGMI